MTILTRLGQVLKTDISTDVIFKKKNIEEKEYDLLADMRKRRSIYALSNRVSHSPEYLTELIKQAVRCCPSAQNAQSARVVILLEHAHYKFWEMVRNIQRNQLPERIFEGASVKLDRCSSAYGTVLFFEDQAVIQTLQKQKPLQAHNFEIWSEQTSGMVQFAVWTALSSTGLGASLHHYNPNINHETAKMFDLPDSWQFKSQLVFGSIVKPAIAKSELEDGCLFKVFSDSV
ncbi:nitroreductase family protein [Acinetobacter sp. 1207_04]|uniref:nitroreductase family protein n=1 Tax=Acinetobacter sp. 1207_04 TaxID=2604449 RepID=UPI004059D448